jgi:hypothetical protein
MRVTVNQARQNGELAQIDHLGVGRNLYRVWRPDCENFIFFDKDDLVAQKFTRLTVEEMARSDGNNRGGLRLCGAAVREYCEKTSYDKS